MKSERTSSNSVRIPTPKEGVAIHVHRYHDDRAVIIHPSDFVRFTALENLLAKVAEPDEFELSDTARAAHIESVKPGEPVTDPDELARLFS
jgi:hypothetical protein